MENKIAEQIILSMGSQMDLIFTLSVAICGGILGLFVQIAIQNSQPSSPLKFDGYNIFLLTFSSAAVSILLGYLSRGAITSSIPEIYKIDFSKISSWNSVAFDGYNTLKKLFLWQFLTFLFSILSLFYILFTNRENFKR